MSEDSSITRNRLLNRSEVTRRRRSVAESDMTLRADKRRALVFLIELVIEDAAVVECRRNVTTLRAATRFDRNSLAGHDVTLRAFHVRVCFMSKGAGRVALVPSGQHPPIRDADRAGQLPIEICRVLFTNRSFVTRIAASRQWRELTLLVVTGEAGCVRQWLRLESSFLQPKRIADVFGRFGNEFIIRLALRLIGLMAVGAIGIRVLLMWERDTKL